MGIKDLFRNKSSEKKRVLAPPARAPPTLAIPVHVSPAQYGVDTRHSVAKRVPRPVSTASTASTNILTNERPWLAVQALPSAAVSLDRSTMSGSSLSQHGQTQSLPRVLEEAAPTRIRPTTIVDAPVSVPAKYLVGIDFGTAYSGFALFRVPEDRRSGRTITLPRIMPGSTNNLTIFGKTDWKDHPQGVFSEKTPTVLAYRNGDRSNGILEDNCRWGWTAKCQNNDASFTRLERIKLALEPSTPLELRPAIPAGMDITDVIADYLALLREEILYLITSTSPMDNNLQPDDLLLCMTVPVGWSQQAHQNLRRAAAKASLISDENSRHLLFCFEPEAAALACVHESLFQMVPGSTILVVDCGGGTVDLFLSRLDNVGELEELTVGTGDFSGATIVDAEFQKFLGAKIGKNALDAFKTLPKLRERYALLEMQWESKKRSFSGTEDFLITLPVALQQVMDPEKVQELEELEINVTVTDMLSFFDPAVNRIVQLIKDQLRQANASPWVHESKITYLYVVGGFGSNKYLQQRINSDRQIKELVHKFVTLQRPEAAVVHGAVWFCLNHQSIKSLRARKTIGIGVQRYYDPARDHVSEITARDPRNPARAYVAKSVLCFLNKGQVVTNNAEYKCSGFKVYGDAWSDICVSVYTSDHTPSPSSSNRLEVDECELLGTITIEVPANLRGGPLPTFTIEIGHGRVELTVCITEETTKQKWTKFLNHGSFKVQT
ncbi:hypothetical protein AMAG_14765 [Allomyces macrogynus ATCC 38327]|uniref:Hsp70-like protein n=1 Tax=Allomyces macrogynus (strain ATCC 38327) TaxID=578462 RepID=A0A0L0T5A0_ALLM3|nr:hypothetical protein, variant [Allomyces macrogynus ATCC 38327]KNE69917.1 hypothetical protein AMAG_14765 [Allomyces macrogynus ATCC 38327]|eukprot:KNE69916.1 hypothetical protein, variant [Allomyces macrogynus ATCC 38327]